MSTYAQTARGRRRGGTGQRRRGLEPVEFGRERFRFTLRREQRRLVALNIDPFVEHCDWMRDRAARQGEVNFRRPLTGLEAAAIAHGDRVRCEVDLQGTGRWRRLWEMTVDTPSQQIQAGIIAIALRSGLKNLEESQAAFVFKGKTARQITLAVARRFNVDVGKLPRARHRIGKLTRKNASPVDVIAAAWAKEREATGRRFDVDVSRGVVDVTELREPEHMLLIRDAIMDATIDQVRRRMVSAVVVTSTRTVSGRKRKIREKVVDRARVRRFGYVVRHVNEPNLRSAAAARRHGKQVLARVAKPTGEITFTHPGLPYLDRGDAIKLTIEDAAIVRVLAFVKSTSHAVSAGSYVMDVTVGFGDPWVDVRQERAKAKRAAAARRRDRPHAVGVVSLKPRRGLRRAGS